MAAEVAGGVKAASLTYHKRRSLGSRHSKSALTGRTYNLATQIEKNINVRWQDVGTRLRPHAHSQPKPLIPVAGKTYSGFHYRASKNRVQRDSFFVIGYTQSKDRKRNIIPEFLRSLSCRINAGLSHAIWLDFLTSSPKMNRCSSYWVIPFWKRISNRW